MTSVHMAQRRCVSGPGGRMGRAQRGRAAADLRQVRRRPPPSSGSTTIVYVRIGFILSMTGAAGGV